VRFRLSRRAVVFVNVISAAFHSLTLHLTSPTRFPTIWLKRVVQKLRRLSTIVEARGNPQKDQLFTPLCEGETTAIQQKRFDVARITLQTLVTTYPGRLRSRLGRHRHPARHRTPERNCSRPRNLDRRRAHVRIALRVRSIESNSCCES